MMPTTVTSIIACDNEGALYSLWGIVGIDNPCHYRKIITLGKSAKIGNV